MSESASKSGNRVLLAIGGGVLGALLAGAPLGYQVMSLQGQLEATTRTADQAALDAHNKLVAVQGELDATTSKLQSELDSARTTAASTAQQLAEQRELSAELAKPEIPLQLSVRKAFIDSGYVLQIRNPTPNDIAVAATFESPNGQTMERRLVIDANYVTELGESKGWAFASRDAVTLRLAGHKDLIYMVPLY